MHVHKTTTTDLENGIFFAVYAGSESSQISSKITLFVFRRWTKVLRVWKCHERWGRGLKCRGNQGFLITKQRTTKTTPRGKKQAGRQKTGAQSNIKHSQRKTHERQRISTGLQTQGDYIGRQTRVTRETQLEPLKQWLSNKMGGDRQSTWEHMAPTNKPCAQHTETSGGQPGHTSRTVTERTWGWVINETIFIFGWTIPLKIPTVKYPLHNWKLAAAP